MRNGTASAAGIQEVLPGRKTLDDALGDAVLGTLVW
jgi:hypothetical protein